MIKILKNKATIILISSIIALLTSITILKSNKLISGSNKIDNNLNIDNNHSEEIVEILSNTIIDNKYETIIEDNSMYTIDIELRNNIISKEYTRAIKLFKNFADENSLNLTYIEPIEDRISRFRDISYGEVSSLLENLYELGAETVNYFTEEEGLNIDLSIGNKEVISPNNMTHIGVTYSEIIYKASIENIDSNFNFETSKLNEFRDMLINDNSLKYDLVDIYISNVISNKYNSNSAYLNKIDENLYETITVSENTCYYKIIFNPLS